MKITKLETGYVLEPCEDVQVFFDAYTVDTVCIELTLNGRIVGMVYFEQKSEFFKAWRGMK